jgi:hypothetical protein
VTKYWFPISACCFLLAGCRSVAGSRKALPPPVQASTYQPANPLNQRAPGLLGRAVFRTSDTDPFLVEFEDLVAAPSSSAVSVPIRGAVVEVRSGEGEAVVSSRRIDLKQGTTFAVSAAETLTVQARGGPVELRTVQITGR